ncbi:hypothetical protein K7432_005855 [Basidiobolus ranarum]|uniref:Uncharacterized protein n=1 Tax=Basidiobolus ranarum TaxID=34480 RepID=A0ABR2W2I9_9FUNG
MSTRLCLLLGPSYLSLSNYYLTTVTQEASVFELVYLLVGTRYIERLFQLFHSQIQCCDMLSNEQHPLFKKSLPELPSSNTSLYSAADLSTKNPKATDSHDSQQVFFTPNSIHSQIGYMGTNDVDYADKHDRVLYTDQQLGRQKRISDLPTFEQLKDKPLPLPPRFPILAKEAIDKVYITANNIHSFAPQVMILSSEDDSYLNYSASLQTPQLRANSDQFQLKGPLPFEFQSSVHTQQPMPLLKRSLTTCSYSYETIDTESLSSTDDSSGTLPSRSWDSFNLPPNYKSTSLYRTNSVSATLSSKSEDLSCKKSRLFSLNWKLESPSKLNRVKNPTSTNSSFSKLKSGKNPFKTLSRVLSSIPSGGGGNTAAQEVIRNLGVTPAQRIETYKRMLYDLQKQQTKIHSWASIVRMRGHQSKFDTHMRTSLVLASSIPEVYRQLRDYNGNCIVTAKHNSVSSIRSKASQPLKQHYVLQSSDLSQTRIMNSTEHKPIRINSTLNIPITTSDSISDWNNLNGLTKLKSSSLKYPHKTILGEGPSEQADDPKGSELKKWDRITNLHTNQEIAKPAGPLPLDQSVTMDLTTGKSNSPCSHAHDIGLHNDKDFTEAQVTSSPRSPIVTGGDLSIENPNKAATNPPQGNRKLLPVPPASKSVFSKARMSSRFSKKTLHDDRSFSNIVNPISSTSPLPRPVFTNVPSDQCSIQDLSKGPNKHRDGMMPSTISSERKIRMPLPPVKE